MSDERTISIPSITLLYDDSKLISVGIGGEMFVCGRAFRCKAVPLEYGDGRIAKGQTVCSECGCYLGENTMIMRNGEFGMPNYCPACGRKVEK